MFSVLVPDADDEVSPVLQQLWVAVVETFYFFPFWHEEPNQWVYGRA